MALTGAVVNSVDVKSPADKFYKLWKTQIYHLPGISNHIQSIDVHEGDWHVDGSVKLWNYTLDGKALTAKEQVSFDDANKAITFNAIDGDPMKLYNIFKCIVKESPKQDGNGSTVTWTIEYEKVSTDVALRQTTWNSMRSSPWMWMHIFAAIEERKLYMVLQ